MNVHTQHRLEMLCFHMVDKNLRTTKKYNILKKLYIYKIKVNILKVKYTLTLQNKFN